MVIISRQGSDMISYKTATNEDIELQGRTSPPPSLKKRCREGVPKLC